MYNFELVVVPSNHDIQMQITSFFIFLFYFFSLSIEEHKFACLLPQSNSPAGSTQGEFLTKTKKTLNKQNLKRRNN